MKKMIAYSLLVWGMFCLSLMADKLSVSVRITELAFLKECPHSVYVREVREWKSGQPAVWLEFNVKKDYSASNFFFKAYLYGADDALIAKLDSANAGHRFTGGQRDTIFSAPTNFKKDENYNLHFRIPSNVDLDAVRRVLLIYGTPDEMAWKANPNVDISSIEFEEKSKIVQSSSE